MTHLGRDGTTSSTPLTTDDDPLLLLRYFFFPVGRSFLSFNHVNLLLPLKKEKTDPLFSQKQSNSPHPRAPSIDRSWTNIYRGLKLWTVTTVIHCDFTKVGSPFRGFRGLRTISRVQPSCVRVWSDPGWSLQCPSDVSTTVKTNRRRFYFGSPLDPHSHTSR